MSGLIWSGLVSSGLEWFHVVRSVRECIGYVMSGLMLSGLVSFAVEWCNLFSSGLEWSGHVMSGLICQVWMAFVWNAQSGQVWSVMVWSSAGLVSCGLERYTLVRSRLNGVFMRCLACFGQLCSAMIWILDRSGLEWSGHVMFRLIWSCLASSGLE